MQVISQSKLNKLVSAFIGLLSVFQLVIPHAYAQSPAIHKARLSISTNPFVSLVVEKNGGFTSQKLLIHDHLSSIKAVVSESGEVSAYPAYYPYGSSIAQTPINITDKQYTGQRKVSDDSSIYNYKARYYNPTTGIFVQPDSVEGPSRYSYVSGNPIMANDPTGNVISNNSFLPKSDHPSNPTPCSKNFASCIGSRLNYHTGMLSALAFLTPDSSSNWLDQEVKNEKNYISSSEDLSANAISSAVGVAGVFGSNGKISLFLRNALTPEPEIMRKPLSSLKHLGESMGAMSGGSGSVYPISETSVAKIFFTDSHPVEIKHEIATLQQYGGGLLPQAYAGITDDAGKLIGIEMERIHGTDMVYYFNRPAIPQDVIERAVGQLKDLKKRGFWHGDIAERNIMIEVGSDGIPNNLRLVDPSRTSGTYGRRTDEVDRFRSIIEFSNAIWQGN